MGGKTKQACRTKSNAQPSNSGRSAELLQNAGPNFREITSQSFTSGFTTEVLSENFDSSTTEFHLVLRKLSKKDPITKIKGLQELNAQVLESDIKILKTLLPLWPRLYQNLANDVEHRIRESTQNVHNTITLKAGKAIAPHIKQLIPEWIASRFDSYGPASSLALISFNSSFSSHKVPEVFIYCQNEIVEYIVKMLTFHSTSTLSNLKIVTTDEAENKYQRMVIASLKTFSLFLEITSKSNLNINEKCRTLLQNKKVWSLVNHKNSKIRSAFFELLCSVLQYSIPLIQLNKSQVMETCFHNLDDLDPITSPYIWECVLLIQTFFIDWPQQINFKKVVQAKFRNIFKKMQSGGILSVAKYFLPFLSKIAASDIKDLYLIEFYEEFFDNIKSILQLSMNDNIPAVNTDINCLVMCYFECLRFVFQQQSVEWKENKPITISLEYLQKYTIEFIKWSLVINNVLTRSLYRNCSTLIAYFSSRSESVFYLQLITFFWTGFSNIITDIVTYDSMEEIYVRNVVEFIKQLSTATPDLRENKVRFNIKTCEKKENDRKIKCTDLLVKDLRELVIKFVQILMDSPTYNLPNKYSSELKILFKIFGDSDFYMRLSREENLITTLSKFVECIYNSEKPSENLIDIIFDIINILDENKRLEQLKLIIKIEDPEIQLWILKRILSYPLCINPEIKIILSEKNVIKLIFRIAKDAVQENSTDKFLLLHNCFFKTDSAILINQETVEGIMNTFIDSLFTSQNEHMLDSCGRFVAQFMPAVCAENNSSKDFRFKVFMKLFELSVVSTANQNLTEDLLREITNSWQDSLSKNDILLCDFHLIECRNIIENKLEDRNIISIEQLDNISIIIAKLILYSSDYLQKKGEEDNIKKISIKDCLNIFLRFSNFEKKTLTNLNNICKFFESLGSILTIDYVSNDYNEKCTVNMNYFYRKIYITISVLLNIMSNINSENKEITELVEKEFSDDAEINVNLSQINEIKNYENLVFWVDCCDIINFCMAACAIGKSLNKNSSLINDKTKTIIDRLIKNITILIKRSSDNNIKIIKKHIYQKIFAEGILWLRIIPLLLHTKCYHQCDGNGQMNLMEELSNFLLTKAQYELYNNLIEIMCYYLAPRSLCLKDDILKNVNLKIHSSIIRNLLRNHFSSVDYSDIKDKIEISNCIKFITQMGEIQAVNKTQFLYNEDISTKDFKDITAVVEYIKLLNEVLERFPTELTIKNWDSIRIGLCSWVLSISKSIDKIVELKISLFVVSVYELFATFSIFIKRQKFENSCTFLLSVIDEWENIFSKEVNLVLCKSYITLVREMNRNDSYFFKAIIEKIASCMIYIDYTIIYNACENSSKLNVSNIIEFAMDNLIGVKMVSTTSVHILKCITVHLIKNDLDKFEQNNEIINAIGKSEDWHILKKFEVYLDKYNELLKQYTDEFSYKLSQLHNLKPIKNEFALAYFYLWDCIIHIILNSPGQLKCLYATWITNNKYENLLLNFIFRAMPLEILKNYDQKFSNNYFYKTDQWEFRNQDDMSVEKFACYMYSRMLKHLPVIVRKWWNLKDARQKQFIEKLTINYVSNLIWLEDLLSLNEANKQENMQITVHQSTREIMAVYSIDEARMELTITLPQNHPLGVIKVEIGKQIGNKTSSRNFGMQLSIFLTHQNGSIFDGLLLWKRNLDKKFAGVEECYVCYTVIHQDTCQLPKLTCKTCKKKFHGPCLYKWFTTSSKSTCPLCRNVF